ncbi:catalase [Helicobacter suis]|uniref:catalase n=1 Tax=Helicobacter suis TaxID=104628 RepID=UPI001F0773BD|nr:catalase [Helicobacter suis]
MKDRALTNAVGAPVGNNQDLLTAGPKGPALLQNTWFLEKLAHFDRERIPERVVHAKGSGAYGTLTVTSSEITKYSKAKLFSEVGKKTPCFLRFSTVAGEKGSADAERDPRGFALKLYTEEGNWDIVGNNTPVFFIRDPLKFPDFIHTQKRHPQTNLKDATMVWDFFSLMPESLHQITILMSDRGIPKSYRHMNGYGSHTFSLINKKEERFWVKLHFKTLQGIKNLSSEEAARIRMHDMDSHQRDLFRAIEQKDYPKWRFCMQIMPKKDAKDYKFHPFDITTRAVKPLALAKRIKAFLCYNVRYRVGASTLGVEVVRPASGQALIIPESPSFSYGEYVNKVWSHKDYPLMKVGILKLNKNPQNYFAKVKQSTFNPANIVPGIGYSPDYMLQGRLFTYKDTQRYRLGIEHSQLPVNAPRCPFATSFKDGLMQSGHYAIERKPSSLPGGYKEVSHARKNKLDLSKLEEEFSAYAYDFRELDNDYYTQASDLFNLMSKEEQERTCQNIVDSMQGVPEQIIKRQLEHFNKANAHYGARVKELWQIRTNATLV